jgi:hypothetical protein
MMEEVVDEPWSIFCEPESGIATAVYSPTCPILSFIKKCGSREKAIEELIAFSSGLESIH